MIVSVLRIFSGVFSGIMLIPRPCTRAYAVTNMDRQIDWTGDDPSRLWAGAGILGRGLFSMRHQLRIIHIYPEQ